MPDRTGPATPATFFTPRPPGQLGLALFLNAGDPPLAALPDLVQALDEVGVDCLELAVPFPNSCSDGPTIRRSANRALANGADLTATVEAVGAACSRLRHLRLTLLADWSHTVRPIGMPRFVRTVADSPVDAVLVHGLPPVLRPDYLRTAAERGVPVVTTCYASSPAQLQASTAETATAYVYLVARYGRTGAAAGNGYHRLSPTVAALRARTTAPIAIGFGVRDRGDLDGILAAGADAAIVGSAVVARVESALTGRRDVGTEIAEFTAELRGGVHKAPTSSLIGLPGR